MANKKAVKKIDSAIRHIDRICNVYDFNNHIKNEMEGLSCELGI